jgi:hypothetical protein
MNQLTAKQSRAQDSKSPIPPAPIENTGPTAKKQASWHQNQWFPFFGIEKTSSFISPENDSREVHVINSMTGVPLN